MAIPPQYSETLTDDARRPERPRTWSSQHYKDLYRLEQRWAEKMIEEHRPFILYGGRRIGKSPILEWIRDELLVKRERYRKVEPGESPVQTKSGDEDQVTKTYCNIDGSAPQTARDALRSIAQGDAKPGAVLIDDIDQILGWIERGSAVERENAGSDQVAHELHELLKDLRSLIPVGGENQLILTATEDVHEPRFESTSLRHEEELWSSLFTRIERRNLNPWASVDWAEDLAFSIRKRLAPETSPESPLPETARRRLAELIPEAVCSLSGGHPNLVGQLLDILQELWGKSDELRDPVEIKLVGLCQDDPTSRELDKLLLRYLEDKLVRSPRGLRALRRSLLRLNTEHRDSQTTAPTTFSELIRIARSGRRGTEAPNDFDIRHQLTSGGLVYEDPRSLRFVVPGKLLRAEVLRFEDDVRDPQNEQHLALAPAPNNPDEGVLVLNRVDQPMVQVPLDGRNWRILMALDQQRGRVMSIDDLATALEANTKATRSALSRLNAKLKEYEIEGILDNQWGKGYRLIEPS